MSNITVTLSNNIDTVPVNDAHEILDTYDIYSKILVKADNNDIQPTKITISYKSIIGAVHVIDSEQILHVILNPGCKVLKNSAINICVEGTYRRKPYKISEEIKILPVIHEEVCLLKLSSDIIKVNAKNEYDPAILTASITRRFAGNTAEFKNYKQYCITYAYSDDLDNEIEYNPEIDVITFRDLNIANRFPNYMLFNLYKTSVDNIPVQTLKLKFKRQGFKNPEQCYLELSDTDISVLTTADNYIIDDTTVQIDCKFNIGNNTYSPIIIDDTHNINIDVKTYNEADEELLSGMQISTDITPEGFAQLNILFKEGIRIPDKITYNVTAYTIIEKYGDTVQSCSGLFTIKHNPSLQSIYQLQPNSNTIRVNKNSIVDPLVIGVDKYQWIANKRFQTDLGFVLYSIDASEPKLYEEPVDTAIIKNNILFEYYDDKLTLLDRI